MTLAKILPYKKKECQKMGEKLYANLLLFRSVHVFHFFKFVDLYTFFFNEYLTFFSVKKIDYLANKYLTDV